MYLDEEGKHRTMQGIPRPISIREISVLQLKICFMKVCQLYATHVEDLKGLKNHVLNIFSVLQEFEDVFKEIPLLLPKRDIYLCIDLVPRTTLV
jgi:hypothetical protein